MAKIWTPAQDEWLEELVRSGYSTSQIAERALFPVTTNAVAGRIWRLRKASGDETLRAGFSVGRRGTSNEGGNWRETGPKTREEKAIASRDRWRMWERRNGGAAMNAIKSVIKRQRRLLEGVMNQHKIVCCGDPVSIWDLSDCKCKWPIWRDGAKFSQQYYCGNKAIKPTPYCEAHNNINTNKAPGTYTKTQHGNKHAWKRAA